VAEGTRLLSEYGAESSIAGSNPALSALLSAEDLAALTARGIPRSFPRGQALFHVGQVPDRVLLLRKGRVNAATTTSGGRSVVLAVRGPGDPGAGRAAALGVDRRARAGRRGRVHPPPTGIRVLDWSSLRP
jgi:CRP-like cAMP-binding protein